MQFKTVELHPLVGDSAEYELIKEGIQLSKDVEGMCLELGLRLGGGIKEIIDGVSEFCPGKVVISVDPFGNIPYEHKEGEFVQYGEEYGYSNNMKDTCLMTLHEYVREKKVYMMFLQLEDTEFFKRYADGIPVYRNSKTIQDKYSFVHFDGPHAIQPLIDEIEFFLPRSNAGSIWCFDDIGHNIEGTPYQHYYDHDFIEKYLFERNFELIRKGHVKATYRLKA